MATRTPKTPTSPPAEPEEETTDEVEVPWYWTQLHEYMAEAEHEEMVPETPGEFIIDFVIYLDALTSAEEEPADPEEE